jgi:hypothetical protein
VEKPNGESNEWGMYIQLQLAVDKNYDAWLESSPGAVAYVKERGSALQGG